MFSCCRRLFCRVVAMKWTTIPRVERSADFARYWGANTSKFGIMEISRIARPVRTALVLTVSSYGSWRASWRRSRRPALVITPGNAVVGAFVGAPGLAEHTWSCLIISPLAKMEMQLALFVFVITSGFSTFVDAKACPPTLHHHVDTAVQ